MGREATITYKDVSTVAEVINVAGGKPTTRAIRERLGNTGSMGTINKFLQEWKQGRERKITSTLALPMALQSAILDFMERELTSAKFSLETELREQRQEAHDLATENERQAADINHKVEEMTSLHGELAMLQGRLGQMESDLHLVKEEADKQRKTVEAARIELAKALLRLEGMPRLESDLTEVRVEFNREHQGRIEAEQRAAVLSAKLDAAMERALKAENSALDAVNEMKFARDEAAELRGKHV